MMDIWAVLGIHKTTDEREIKRAYAKMLAKYHPEDEPEKFQEIKEAYELALKHAKGLVKSDDLEEATFDEFSNAKHRSSYYGWRDNYDYGRASTDESLNDNNSSIFTSEEDHDQDELEIESNTYYDWHDSYSYEQVSNDESLNDNNDSIFRSEEDHDQDELELEKKRVIADKLIKDLKAIKEPDITIEKLERLFAEIDYEFMETNPYFLSFTKELKEYLIVHCSFFARRQHLFAIINNRFKYLFTEAEDCGELLYGNSGNLDKFSRWLDEFDKHLKERAENIRKMDRQYGESFRWESDSSQNIKQNFRKFEQKYKKSKRQYKRQKRSFSLKYIGQLLLDVVIILSNGMITIFRKLPTILKLIFETSGGIAAIPPIILFGFVIVAQQNSEEFQMPTDPARIPPITPAQIDHAIIEEFLSRDFLASHEDLAPFEWDIYEAITEYLFEEYGEEFTTSGCMYRTDLGSMLTLLYFLVNDPLQSVMVSIYYEINDDEIEIMHIFQTPMSIGVEE